MQYGLALILICAAGIAAASALPVAGPRTVSISKAEPAIQIAKRNRVTARHRSRSDNGIHPLVGSGNY
jgi:hypothetical protein